MRTPLRTLALGAFCACLAVPVLGQESVDWEMVTRIREEGLHRSQVMDTLAHLTDTIGPRLTGSPAMKEANEWTRDTMTGWGLENAHLESFGPFGRGWTFSYAAVHMTQPRQTPLSALPKAWTPGTDGPVRGQAMKIKLESKRDLEKWRGQLAGKILFLDEAREISFDEAPTIDRRSAEDLAEMVEFPIPGDRGRRGGPGDWRERARKRYELRDELHQFLVDEGVVATVSVSSFEGGLVRVTGGGAREKEKNPGVPALVMAAEQYNGILRLLPDIEPEKKEEKEGAEAEHAEGEHAEAAEGEVAEAEAEHAEAEHAEAKEAGDEGEAAEGEAEEGEAEEGEAEDEMSEAEKFPVELEIDIRAQFHDEDEMVYNTVAEIPGTDPNAGLVVLGAHLDSWHAGTGSNDNAAGCAVMMEAARILKALGVEPKRTIQVALWAGEEQGLLGSRAYVEDHLAKLPQDEENEDMPRWLQRVEGEVETLPAHKTFAAYFNVDNGSGKIRGVYAEENAAAGQIFKAWLEPFHDLGADTVTMRRTGGTDHQSFGAVGLPGFQFIQDRLDYSTRTHHSNLDLFDRAVREDLMQASVIVASFAYHAAMRDEILPRKPMPRYEARDDDD